jgi:hypothetical protein
VASLEHGLRDLEIPHGSKHKPKKQEEHNDRESRSVAVSVIRESRLVNVGHKYVSLVCRHPAARDEPDDVHVVESPDCAEDDRGCKDGPQQGDRHVLEFPQCTCPVELRSFVEFMRDALKTAERHDHHEWEAQPYVCDNGSYESPSGIGEPWNRCMMKYLHQNEIDCSILVIEHTLPRERTYVLRDCPGEDEKGAKDPATIDSPIKDQRDGDANGHVKENVHNGPHDCLAEHPVEFPLAKDFGKLTESDKRGILEVVHAHVLESEDEIVDEWVQYHDEHHDGGGQNECVRKELSVAGKACWKTQPSGKECSALNGLISQRGLLLG